MNIRKIDNSYIIEEKSAKKINHKNSVTVAFEDGVQATMVRLSHGAKGKQANVRLARLRFDGDRFNEEQVKDYCSRYQVAYFDLDINGSKLIREIKDVQYMSDHEVAAVMINDTPKDQTLSQRIGRPENYDRQETTGGHFMNSGVAKPGNYYRLYHEKPDVISAIGAFNSASIIQKPDDRDLVAVYFDVMKKCARKEVSEAAINDEWENGPRLFTLFNNYTKNHPLFSYLNAYLTVDELHRQEIDEIVSFIDSLTGNYSEVSLSVTYGVQQEYIEESYHDQEIDHLFNVAHMTAALTAMYTLSGGAVVCVSRKDAENQYYGFAAKEGSLVTLSAENLKWALSQQADGSEAEVKGEYLEAPFTLDATVVRG